MAEPTAVCAGCGAQQSLDLWTQSGSLRAWLSDALEGWSTRAIAPKALNVLEAAARRLTLTGAPADLLASAISRLKTASEAPQPPSAEAAPARAKKRRKTGAPPAGGTEGGALGATGHVKQASFRLTPTRKPTVGAGTRKTLLAIACSTVGLFLWIANLNYPKLSSPSSPRRDIRAELRARCGDLGPLRCRLKAECDRADANGCYELGVVQEVGNGGPIDVGEAMRNYTTACSLQSANGCRALADLHRNGHGVVRDLELAAALDVQACRLGLEVACAASRAD